MIRSGRGWVIAGVLLSCSTADSAEHEQEQPGNEDAEECIAWYNEPIPPCPPGFPFWSYLGDNAVPDAAEDPVVVPVCGGQGLFVDHESGEDRVVGIHVRRNTKCMLGCFATSTKGQSCFVDDGGSCGFYFGDADEGSCVDFIRECLGDSDACESESSSA